MDFEVAAKLSGARFVVLKGPTGAARTRVLQFMLDLHTRRHGYEEINPPVLVRDEAMFGTAQLPKFLRDQFAGVDPVAFVQSAIGNGRLARAHANAMQEFEPPGARVQYPNADQSAAREFELATEAAVMQAQKLWLDPDRRSLADQSRPRIHRR